MRYLLILVYVALISSCKGNEKIVKEPELAQFIQPGIIATERKKIVAEKDFWAARLQKDTGSFVNMLEVAGQELALFRLTGDIKALQRGDSLLRQSSAKLNDSDPELLFSLSQNSITHHRFRQAAYYNKEADKKQGDLYINRLLQFDTWMELGKYEDAYKALEVLKDRNAFDVLIRRSKWEDHLGNLDEAIRLMEQAFEKLKTTGDLNRKKNLYCWALTNLADMYGHAGRIEDSYQAYLAVLKTDPSNLYSLKGLAWIAYSHDGDSETAKKLIGYILSQSSMPDLKLLMAEIAESENKPREKEKWVADFITEVSQPGYGDMYNKYLIEIYAERSADRAIAFALAEKELQNRFTPETCDWMAWVKYQQGHYEEAYKISKAYVLNRTHEPGALMHTAFIYAANGKKADAKIMLEECLQSSFELGPVATRQIKVKLASLRSE